MIKITFICLLLMLVYSEEYKFGNNDLEKLSKSIFEASNIIKDQLVNEDEAAIFLSNPKAGKSTLINYLIGTKLIAVKDNKGEIIITKADNELTGPEISPGSLPTDNIPLKWKSTILPDLTLWDTPAFFDNRGVVQDVTNAYCLYELLKSVKTLKIILLVDIKDLNVNRAQLFLSLLNEFVTLFGKNIESYFSSVSVIFTKVPEIMNRIPVDYDYINNQLKTIYLNPKLKMDKNSKKFIEYIIDNNDRIALSRKVSKEGKVSLDTNDNIFTTLKDSQFIDKISLKDVHFHISDSSMIMLFNAVEGLLSVSKMNEMEDIASRALLKDTNNIRKLIDDNDSHSINSIKEALTVKKNFFSDSLIRQNDIYKKILILLSFHQELQELDKKDELISKVQIISNIEKLLQVTLSKDLHFSLDIILVSLYLKLKTAISLCNSGLFIDDMSIHEYFSDPSLGNISGIVKSKSNFDKYFENASLLLKKKLSEP